MKPYALAAGAAVSILLAACGSSATTAGPTSAHVAASSAADASAVGSKASAGITISGFAYSGTMTVTPGQTVTVTNRDSAAHTLTDKVSHLFDTGNIAGGGGKGSFTAPTKAGSYPFGCTYHPDMKGTLIVRG